jgi:predicted enzyme related to lactoylglutathione lyase
MEVTQHSPGAFCWTDLAAADPAAAKKFYTALFGIEAEDTPMSYTLLKLKGKDVAGIGGLQKEQIEQGVPPHWLSYVCVTNADETAKKAASLGAKVFVPAFDVMNHGRMAVLQDPTGAVFAVWEPKEHIGSRFINEHGSPCWNELMTSNIDVAGRFYTQLFGWSTKVMEMGPTQYTVFELNGKPAGGMMAIAPEMGPVPPNWGIYFAVDDCDARAKKATELGAKTIVAPQDIPGTGRFSILADPQGAVFAIIKLVPM